MDGYVVDTHALVWFLEGNPKPSVRCRDLLLSADVRIFVPAMAILETVDLIQKRRTTIDLAKFEQALSAKQRIEVVPIDQSIAMSTAALQTLTDIHDRCFVATTLSFLSQGLEVNLMTVDDKIAKSNLVTTIW